jgi:hypothetical protein
VRLEQLLGEEERDDAADDGGKCREEVEWYGTYWGVFSRLVRYWWG